MAAGCNMLESKAGHLCEAGVQARLGLRLLLLSLGLICVRTRKLGAQQALR